MKTLKFTALLIVFAFILLSMAACGDDGNTIKVGFIGPMTGDVAVYGIAAKNAAQLYIDQFNKNGGIGGKNIKLIIYDDKGDATEAVNAYNKLVTGDEVVAIIGAITSTPTDAVARASVTDNIPIMTPTATHPDITSYGNNTFRSCFLDLQILIKINQTSLKR